MRCGCSVITAAVISFVLFMVGVFFATEIPPLQSVMEDLYCKPYQYMEKVKTPTNDGTNITYYCRDVEVRRKEITGPVIVTMFAISGAVFVGGVIVLYVLSLLILRRGGSSDPLGDPVDWKTQMDRVNVAVSQVELSPETLHTLRQALASLIAHKGTLMGEEDTLADKLEQLAEARDRGLITPEEFATIRQAILDAMDD